MPEQNISNAPSKQPYLLFTAIIIAGLLIAGAIVLKQDNAEQKAQSANSALNADSKSKKDKNEIKIDPKNINIAGEGDDPMLGNPNAPITMAVFKDFQCHFCKKLHMETLPEIVEKYVKTGKVKIIDRDFPFLGPASVLAAEAANCAFEQNKYWEYVDTLHSVQGGHDSSPFKEDRLKEYADNIGLNADKFNKCLNSEKYFNEVSKDFEEGKALGVKGTPTTYINNEVLNGALPFEDFEKVIEGLLAGTTTKNTP